MKIQGYEIDELIGEGVASKVYRARQTSFDRTVALKVLVTDETGGDKASDQRRFTEGAKLAASVTHPHSIAVFEIGEGENSEPNFLAAELLSSETLEDRLNSGLPVTESIKLFLQLCDGLEAAHKQSIVHGDIKARNVLFRSADQVVLMDYLGSGVDEFDDHVIFGSPAYMSPERVKGKETTVRADVYSMGVLLFEMLSGNKPFIAKNALEVARLQVSADIPLLPDSYKHFNVVIKRMLAKNPMHRYSSIARVKTDVKYIWDAFEQSDSDKTQVLPCISDNDGSNDAVPSVSTPVVSDEDAEDASGTLEMLTPDPDTLEGELEVLELEEGSLGDTIIEEQTLPDEFLNDYGDDSATMVMAMPEFTDLPDFDEPKVGSGLSGLKVAKLWDIEDSIPKVQTEEVVEVVEEAASQDVSELPVENIRDEDEVEDEVLQENVIEDEKVEDVVPLNTRDESDTGESIKLTETAHDYHEHKIVTPTVDNKSSSSGLRMGGWAFATSVLIGLYIFSIIEKEPESEIAAVEVVPVVPPISTVEEENMPLVSIEENQLASLDVKEVVIEEMESKFSKPDADPALSVIEEIHTTEEPPQPDVVMPDEKTMEAPPKNKELTGLEKLISTLVDPGIEVFEGSVRISSEMRKMLGSQGLSADPRGENDVAIIVVTEENFSAGTMKFDEGTMDELKRLAYVLRNFSGVELHIQDQRVLEPAKSIKYAKRIKQLLMNEGIRSRNIRPHSNTTGSQRNSIEFLIKPNIPKVAKN